MGRVFDDGCAVDRDKLRRNVREGPTRKGGGWGTPRRIRNLTASSFVCRTARTRMAINDAAAQCGRSYEDRNLRLGGP